MSIGGIQLQHGAVRNNRPNVGIEARKNALRLAERVAEHDACAPRVGIAAPPCVELRKDLGLRPPVVDRQPEGGFGDEGIASHRLERRAGAVRLDLVVAGHDPHFAAVFQPHLRGAQHVTRRVEAQPDAVVDDGFAVRQRLQGDIGTQARAQHAGPRGGSEVVLVPDAGVVTVGVRDDGAVNRPPWVNVEVACRAIQAAGRGYDQVRCAGHRLLSLDAPSSDARDSRPRQRQRNGCLRTGSARMSAGPRALRRRHLGRPNHHH